ncbi:hypothetical protein EVAR_3879_1 [Eumeta japonica]|uniref:Helitron helicase-like domain-containing protein n=1 Tax=Eumeta variegata TaxID=151549 RepID=A0A4C1SQU0_EUMVA|nr:hypothetical protein EVAR_3879_1 [Eumeta japonica]
MNKECRFCGALKWKEEAAGMCCSGGKVALASIDEPVEPLKELFSHETDESRRFLKNIRKYNTCFHMTSFGADNIVSMPGFCPTFTIQGQVYHTIGSLLPATNTQPKFLQVYFMGDEEAQVNRRSEYVQGLDRNTVQKIQQVLHNHNILVHEFKMAKDRVTSDNYKVVIHPDRVPRGEHERRFNAPTTNEIAALVVSSEQTASRDIVIQAHDDRLTRVPDTHRFYDALEYPIIFWKGQGTRTVLIFLRQTQLLLLQFLVDMYVKVESERLRFIALNQTKLRAENYIHLQDAIRNDADLNPNNLGQMVILPSSFVNSPRYLHEYTQDAFTYVRNYGRPDLFITMTCNPAWPEITTELMPGQNSTDRHDLTARVFKIKVQKLVALLTKGKIFGDVKCFMYSIEWQKRGLPHVHLLLWLMEKLRPNQIDEVISAEIPNPETDRKLYDTVTKNMIHGPCGALNSSSPCMKEGKCTKKYPRALLKDTQTNDKGYPLYRRRAPEDGGRTIIQKTRGHEVLVDNRWIVPYSPLLSKIFNCHINVEFCNTVQAIKYICKYINKGSDQAILTSDSKGMLMLTREMRCKHFEPVDMLVATKQRGGSWVCLCMRDTQQSLILRYICPMVSGFTSLKTILERMAAPPKTTLTAFFLLCQNDAFAKHYFMLMYPATIHGTLKEWKRRLQRTLSTVGQV